MSRVHVLERIQRVPVAPEQAFGFLDAHNLEAITPPWLRFSVLTSRPIAMAPGTRIDYRLTLHHVPIRWETEIREWAPDRRFVDVQRRGPYRLWEHTHEFRSVEGGTELRDRVRYALPGGVIGGLAHLAFVARDVGAIFDFRAAEIARRMGA